MWWEVHCPFFCLGITNPGASRDRSDSIGSLRSLELSRVERAEPIGVGSGAKPNRTEPNKTEPNRTGIIIYKKKNTGTFL